MAVMFCESRIVLLCVFVLANLPAQVAVTPVITPEDVLSMSEEKCVVAISDKLLQQTTRVRNDASIDRLLGLANVAFREEPNVLFGVSNLETFVWPSGKRLQLYQNTKDPTAVVFKQIVLKDQELKIGLRSSGYTGSGSVADFIAFVNEHCNTYRSQDGRLTLDGLRRKALLEDLFKVEQLPQSVTISQVFQTPDLLHSDKNCLRKDGSDVCDSSQSLHSGIDKFHGIPRCERISSPSRHKFFNEYLARSRPVIITDAMDNWPAMSKWTTEFLRDRYGDKIVPILLAPNGVYEVVEPASKWDIEIPQALQKELPYPDLVVVRPAVLDMKFSDVLDFMRNLEEQHIWLSDGNTLGKTHFDPFDNFLCQVSGEKEVILFEPHSNERLYEAFIPEADMYYNPTTKQFHRPAQFLKKVSVYMSPVDIQQPNLERFKKFGEARPMSCTSSRGKFCSYQHSGGTRCSLAQVPLSIEIWPSTSVSDYFPELKDDIEEMPFFKNTLQLEEQCIWLSDGNTLGKTHFDPFDNFLCQVSGEKEVILFEPHSNERLYEAFILEADMYYNPTTKQFHRPAEFLKKVSLYMSPVDIQQPNLERFKKFGEARPMSCTIRQGEVLFMPAFWWHEVQSRPSPTEHRNLAVNFWYDPFFTKVFPCQKCPLDISGEKEVILFEPHNNERLHEAYIHDAALSYNAATKEFGRANTLASVSPNFSPVDVKQPDLQVKRGFEK
ncbi:hypothetical protein BaRGS_00035624 [Batillaria attramentaria]|uniref:JmjC domain-containing protein n=1 Tax=Batillaria attramentaria TaxID=370345 RepID=A0ABD0JDX8_9CAEN